MKTILLNNILTYYKLLLNILLTDGENSLPKELKIKILQNRFHAYQHYKEYIEYENKCKEECTSERYIELVNKENKTKKEIEEFNKLSYDISNKISELLQNKLNEIYIIKFEFFDDFEFDDIITTNAENSPIIDGNKLSPELFLTYIYDNMVIPKPFKIEYKESSE